LVSTLKLIEKNFPHSQYDNVSASQVLLVVSRQNLPFVLGIFLNGMMMRLRPFHVQKTYVIYLFLFKRSSCVVQDDDVVTVQIVNGRTEIKEKIAEYVNRGDRLQNWSYLDFFLGTYDGKTLQERNMLRGRTPNERVPYQPNTQPEGRCQILRTTGHDTMPYIPGPWLAKQIENEEGGLFEASILALLKPWRSLTDLKPELNSFRTAFEQFIAGAADETKRAVENIVFVHDCSKKRTPRTDAGTPTGEDLPQQLFSQDSTRDVPGTLAPDVDNLGFPITEEHINTVIDRPFSSRELKYADEAVNIGILAGAFAVGAVAASPPESPHPASVEQFDRFRKWEIALCNADLEVDVSEDAMDDGVAPLTLTENRLHNVRNEGPSISGMVNETQNDESHDLHNTNLNEQQQMVFNIICHHLDQHLQGKNPPQRLLIVHGQGGTGKSTLMNAISTAFRERGGEHLLAKTATSGVAACIIGGQTLHSWAALPIAKPSTDKWVTHPGKAIDRRRRKNIGPILWLFVDEMSMLTTPLLELLSCTCSVVRVAMGVVELNSAIAFGNVSVVLLGDPHQFPPVATSHKELYCPNPIGDASRLGRSLYEQFDIVVKLDKQMRIRDPVWDGILHRLRTGDCTCKDIAEIKKLVIGNSDCDTPDFTTPPWDDAVLITPRNGSCSLWNERTLQQHCRRSRQTLFSVYARDSCDDDILTPRQRLAVAHLKKNDTHHLPHKIELAVGMKAMVLLNIATDADLANGTRGVVEDIILDAREKKPDAGETTVRLEFLPAVILFRPLYGQKKSFPGLPDGVVPIFPTHKKFTLNEVEKCTILREQFALTPAYAFTDYKSQGQTIENVIVDLTRPPSGKLSAFNAYVTLSRSRGRKNIRLLRDFDERLFTVHPHEDLRKEDGRLLELETETLCRYNAGKFGWFPRTVPDTATGDV
jgi:hypothetical protein